MVDGSVKLDGEIVDYEEEDDYFIVEPDNTSGKLVFCFKPVDANGYMMSYAQMSYYLYGNRKTETVGIVNMAKNLFTINVPSETKTRFITVTGVTEPEKRVSVYIDGKLSGTVTSSKVGVYSHDILLPSPADGDVFKIEAALSDDDDTRAYSYVTYSEDIALLTKFDMHYRGNTYDLIELADKRPVISWASATSFSFVVEFDDNTLVDEVYILSTKKNEEKRIKAVYDPDNDRFVASGFEDYIPGLLTVEYTEKGPDVLKIQNTSFYGGYENEDNRSGVITRSVLDDGTAVYLLEEKEEHARISNFDKLQQTTTYDGTLCYITYEPVKVYRGDCCFLCTEMYIKQTDGLYTVTRSGYGAMDDSSPVQTTNRVLNSVIGALQTINNAKNADELAQKTYKVANVLNSRYGEDNSGVHYYVLSEYVDKALEMVDSGSTDWGTLQSCKQRLEIYKMQRNSTMIISHLQEVADASVSLDDLSLPGIDKKFKQSFDKMKNAANKESDKVLKGIIKDLTKVDKNKMNVFERVLAANTNYKRQGASKVNSVVDPSGYVYEGVTGNRLDNVQATIYFKEDENSEATVWNAGDFDQMNPLFTDIEGCYAWDVPEGLWQVEFKKDGYETAYSDWVPVPPPQLDLNMGMVSKNAPDIEYAVAYSDEIDVKFSQYMDTASVIGGNIVLTQNGKKIDGIWETVDAEADPKNEGKELASSFRFVVKKALSGVVDISISDVKNYSEKELKSYTDTLSVNKRITKVITENEAVVAYKGETSITIKASSADAAAGKAVSLRLNENDIISVPETVRFDSKGEAVIKITGLLPGTAVLHYNIDDTNLNGEIKICCDTDVDELHEDEKTPGDANGDGNVNMKDLVILQRYLNNWNVEIDINACDLNGDEKVNMKDFVLLQRLLNGWKV